MNSSQTIGKISTALLKAQSAMSNAKKEAVNPFFKKNYADLNSIREAVMPALNANGISIIQPTIVIDGIDYVETILLHESGEFISSVTKIVVDKVNDAQRHGSGLSYARRYALQSIVCIGAEDDDANLATGKNKPIQQQIKPVGPVSNNEALHLSTIEAITDLEVLKAYWIALPKNEKTASVTAMKDSVKYKLEGNGSNA